MKPLVLITLVLTAGCASGFDDPIDARKLTERPRLAHLADAIAGGRDLDLATLLLQGADIDVQRAPNPTTLLNAMGAQNQAADVAGRVPLRVMSYNVALLDARLFAIVPYKSTPHLDDRRPNLASLLFSDGAHIILVQELWLADDVARFEEAALAHDYEPLVSPRPGHTDGLAIFIRRDALDGTPKVEAVSYDAQDVLEGFPGVAIRRGFMSAAFEHPTLGTIVAVNTHMQAFSDQWYNRMLQARQMGLYLRDEVPEDAVVLVAGDLNGASYYREKTWTLPDGTTDDRWWLNALSYPLALEYGDLDDLFVMGRPLREAADDVNVGDTVVTTGTTTVDDEWCRTTPPHAFTASDCNALYAAQYAGEEYPARIDHVFGRAPSGRLFVQSSATGFTEPLRFGDVTIEPSDHYAVVVDLLVAP